MSVTIHEISINWKKYRQMADPINKQAFKNKYEHKNENKNQPKFTWVLYRIVFWKQ